MNSILIIDDDEEVISTVQLLLERENFLVETATDPQRGLDIMVDLQPDLIILDIIMPKMNGIEVCKRIRSNPYTSTIPILFLTAKGRVDDVVKGLDAGGDDYLTKPFELVELPARVRALLRRSPGNLLDTESDSISIGDMCLSRNQPYVIIHGNKIELTTVEHHLLHTLMVYNAHPVSIDTLLHQVWGYPTGTGNPNTVHVTIKRLRGKMALSEVSPYYIRNIRGKGYILSG